ncbi:thiamine-phosphate pyrophosphorylase [Eubacterium maltosivorans]|uniref:thiamine phosphate synthase n=1 Tax=Eubacterium maltosivorans TaxID=2041044 RepID=UPI0008874A25|nr:thiamine phosphate synthase [Eubacterium maltosivorans]WPK81463.1 Thiamine-phosphate synthase [Eubacterium maltosivorans]SDP44693.1 thiamine-phosphate pyrophosphorylase [Eubacterium maltosivorans]
MFEIAAVTNRSCCPAGRAFAAQVARIAASGVSKVILREKDLTPEAYKGLAVAFLRDCKDCGAELFLHSFAAVARELNHAEIHLPLPVLEAQPSLRQDFKTIGVSVHSLEQARIALRLGADYLSAGHVFATDCKKGLAPRGLSFLSEICGEAPVPVYAIGGISAANIQSVREAGAAGACVMSGIMESESPEAYVGAFLQKIG